MKHITLTKGYEAIVDDEDYLILNTYEWHVTKQTYASHSFRDNGKVTQIYMSHFIFTRIMKRTIPEGHRLSFRNGNSLDLRKENLVLMKIGIISHLSMRPIRNKYIKYNKRYGTYTVRFKKNSKEVILGTYRTLEAAIDTRDKYLSENPLF